MREKIFVQNLKKAIIDENTIIYKNLLDNYDEKEVTNEYWSELLPFYRGLPLEKQVLIIKLIQQTAVDTVSNFLGIVDGVVDFPIEIKLMDVSENKIFEDELQDLFLENVEED